MAAEKLKKLRVAKDDNSPTGYTIYSGTSGGVPASNYEVRLWQMYIEALDLARRLRDELDKIVQIKKVAPSKGKQVEGEKRIE